MGSGPEPTANADSCKGRVCVKALVTSFDTAPVPGRTEQSGRALPETQLKDLYSGCSEREQARTAGGRGQPASRPGFARGPRAMPSTAGPCKSLKPHCPPQVPPTATGHATLHRSHRRPWATPTTVGCAVSHRGSHRWPRATLSATGPTNAMDHASSLGLSHQTPQATLTATVPPKPWAMPTATGPTGSLAWSH